VADLVDWVAAESVLSTPAPCP